MSDESSAKTNQSARRWAWLWTPLAAFVVSRLVVLLAAHLGFHLIPVVSDPPPYHLRPTDVAILDVLGSRWDTGFYVSIAEEGYRFEGVPLPSVAFFPLLPLLMRLVMVVVGDAVIAGILVSNLALLVAAILFYRLVALSSDEATAGRAVWYLLIFPAAFFGSAIYTESLFLLCAIGTFYLARRGYWESVALLGLAAGLTRLVGLILLPALLLEWWQQWRSPERCGHAGSRPPRWASVAPLAVPLGSALYMAFLARSFGDPFAFARASEAWGRQPTSPLATLTDLLTRPEGGWLAGMLAGRVHLDNWIDFLFVLLFLAMGLLLWRRRWSEGVYVLLGVIVPFSSGLLMSQRRYMWVLFPVFVLWAEWGRRPAVDRAITALSLGGLTLFTALFANGFWVG